MKIGIISYNKYTFYGNYGSVLQSFALFKYLKDRKYDVEIVDYKPFVLEKRKSWFPYRLRSLYRPKLFVDFFFNEPCHIIRNFKLASFLRKNTLFSKTKFSSSNLDQLDYDIIVYGSDTIWDIKQTNGFDAGFFGKNVKAIKIGYSISIADCCFNGDEIKELIEYANSFKAISFRDDSLSNFPLPFKYSITLDPTFLLSKEDYYKHIKKRKYKYNYLLYFSLSNNQELDSYVKKMAESRNLKVICLSRFLEHIFRFHRNYHAGVEDFLTLIFYADVIVTNSFHGTVFSIIFNKEFYVHKRSGGNKKLEYLLKQLSLEDRLVNINKNHVSSNISYDTVEEKIKILQKESKLFLDTVLDIKNDSIKE